MTSAYNDLVNVASFGKKREYFDAERGEISYYCHDCAKIVSVIPKNEDLARYECSVCGGEKIAIGTEASLKEHYEKKR